MAPKLAIVWMLALALLAGTSVVAPATAVAQDLASSGAALEKAQSQYDAAEATYASAAGGGVDASGFTGQLQQLVAAGQNDQATQLEQTRDAARTSLESAINGYMSALQSQHDALAAAGKNDQAQSVQGEMNDLRSRLQALATDAQNEKLASKGLAPATGPSTGPSSTMPTTPTTSAAPAPAPTTTPAVGSSSPGGAEPIGLATADGRVANGAARTAEKPAPKPRKATGRIIFVARGANLEATLERLDRACALLRDGGSASGETTSGEIEVYLVEHFRDATPTRIRLAKDDAHAAELLRLRKCAGATCSVAGVPEVLSKRTRTEGELVELRDWKVLALSSLDRVAPATTARLAPAKPASTTAPGPLAPQEEENFND